MTTLLEKAEIAERLHCSTRHVERLMLEGLPFIPVGTRRKLFRLESVMQWLLSRESCLSVKTKQASGTLNSASNANAYTDACQRARQKRMQRKSKQTSDSHLKIVNSQPTQA